MALAAGGLTPTLAAASSAIEFPDNGVAQFSRGGAWLATATDPIAGYYNPAALATQASSASVGMNLIFQKMCFTRLDADGSPSSYWYDDRGQRLGGVYPETCNLGSGKPRFVPNLALSWRVQRRLALGLTVVPPASLGATEWPDAVMVREPSALGDGFVSVRRPAPQRYLSLKVEGTILLPTLAVGYAITDHLRVGAGFVAGLALLELRSNSLSTQSSATPWDTAGNDTRSKLEVADWFVPGFVVSAHYEATPRLDLAGWYRWSDSIHAKGDLQVLAPYYDNNGTPRSAPLETRADDAATVGMGVPMEVRLGLRWHQPFGPARPLAAERFRHDADPVRDPLRDDLYDVELDLSWAQNSSADTTEIRFRPGINVNGLPGSVPTNADRPTGYRDSFGARLGGQWNLLRDRLGLRLGTWVESPAVKAEYLTVTGVPALRGGLGGGPVFRVGMADLEFGYQYLWNAGLDNGGDGRLRAILGSGGPPGGPNAFRSWHTVNGGKITQHASVVSVGGVVRF